MNLKKIVSLILAMIMLLGLITVSIEAESESAHVPIKVDGAPKNITVDGVVSYEEWGTPDGHWTYSDNFKSPLSNWDCRIYDTLSHKNDEINMYAHAGENGIYLAFQFVNANGRDQQATVSDPKLCAGLDFSIGTYDSVGNVKHGGDGKEQRYTYRIYETYDAATQTYTTNQAVAKKNTAPALNQVQVGYENATNTYTYEVLVPYDAYIIQGEDIVLAFAIRDKYTTGKTEANSYNVSLAARMHVLALSSAAYEAPFRDYNPMRLTFSDCYVNHTATQMLYKAPTMDGSDPANEWGNPVIVTSPEHAKNTWTKGYSVGKDANQDNSQRAKVYMANDNEYLYIAATVDHAKATTNANASNPFQPLLAVTVSQYVDGGAYKVDNKEQFRFFRVYLKDGDIKIWSRTYNDSQDAGGVAVTSDCYYAGYDDTAQTYTFKMKIAWDTIPGMSQGLQNPSSLAMTVRIGEANLGTTNGHENSYYQIGGTAAGSSLGQVAPHSNGVLKMDINPIVAETPYISDVASAGQDITVDGNISQTEWGAPVAVLAPTSKNFFNQDKEHNDPAQRAKIYLSNDDKYIYVGATLDRSDKGIDFTGKAAWKYPLFWFTLSAWDEDTTVKRVNGTEQYTSYRFNFAEPSVCTTYSQNIAGDIALKDEDWKVVYDPSTGTYTYEARIPLSATNIRYTESLDVAFSAQVGTSLFAENKENDRYNLGLAPANYPEQKHRHEGDNRAVKITLNNRSWLAEGNYVKDTVAEKQGDIVIDANVTTDEWGEPVVVTGPNFAKGYWNPDGYWSKEAVDPNQLAKVYMTNDTNYLYIAATLDHAEAHVNVNALNDCQPQMTVTLSKYDRYTTVARVNDKEQFSTYRIGWNKGGEIKATVSANQLDSFTLSDSDWAVRYDAEAKTYTYELRIPLSTTNINIHETSQIAASIQIGDSNYGTNGNNRYNIGGTGAANQDQADVAGNYPHLGQAMKLNLRQQYYVVDQLSNPNEKIKIDGKINVSEWGQPTIVTNPDHTQTTWGSFEVNEPSCVDQSQTARVWLTSDESYLYVGATLDKAATETKVKNTSGTNLTSVMRSHFMFDIGRYVEETTVPRSKYQGQAYENYAGFILWMGNDGTQNVKCRSLGMDKWTPDKSDYKITYDAGTETYTYEIRIPYAWTQIQPYSKDMVFCGSLGTPYMGEGIQANRYHFETGHTGGQKGGDIPHMGHMIKLAMNTPDFGTVNDSVSPFTGNVSIDGAINVGEWGEPLIVTNINHAKKQWGNVWNLNKKTTDPEQIVTIYATNDEENLYFAATVDHTDFDDSDKANWARAHFFVSIGRHDEETGMERIASQGKTYERFSLIKLFFDAKGQATLTVTNSGIDSLVKTDCDYVITYNEEARTYTYELRIPINKTSLRFGNGNQMQVCFTASPAYVSGDSALRYNIGGTGTAYGNANADNFAHTGKSMTVKLNPNSYVDPVDVYDMSAVNPNYIKNISKNPNSGDTILPVVAVAWISACGLIVTVVMRKKRINK